MLKDIEFYPYILILPIGVLLVLSCSDRTIPQETAGGVNPNEQEKLEQYEEKKLFLRVNEPFKGELEEIRKRRLLRVLVTYSKTNFFIDAGVARGFEYELLHEYEKLNKSFLQQGNASIELVLSDPYLASEDILELVNAGVLDITVTDQHIGEAWSQVLPDSVLKKEVPILNRLQELILEGSPSKEVLIRISGSLM